MAQETRHANASAAAGGHDHEAVKTIVVRARLVLVLGLNVEHRASDSHLVERVWRSGSSGATHMLSIANSNWELLIEQAGHRPKVLVRGPETRPSMVAMPEHQHAVGIVFAQGTALSHLSPKQLVDSTAFADEVPARGFSMAGDVWELPTYENAETFVARLARAGVLRHDDLVSDVAAGAEDHGLSSRSLQRRVATVTGLTQGTIRQIERARAAAELLRRDAPAMNVVHKLGFYDQPHLSRSLRRFIGRTATELQQSDPEAPVSLLYKTRGWDHF